MHALSWLCTCSPALFAISLCRVWSWSRRTHFSMCLVLQRSLCCNDCRTRVAADIAEQQTLHTCVLLRHICTKITRICAWLFNLVLICTHHCCNASALKKEVGHLHSACHAARAQLCSNVTRYHQQHAQLRNTSKATWYGEAVMPIRHCSGHRGCCTFVPISK